MAILFAGRPSALHGVNMQATAIVAGALIIAAVGSAESVRRQLRSYLNAGATDVVLSGLAWAGAAMAEELWAVAASV